MTYFTNKDEQWEQVANALADVVNQQTYIILAPADFIPEFKRVVAYSLTPNFRPDFFDVVAVHKGMCRDLGGLALEYWQENYGVVFANAVFVLLVKGQANTVDPESDDVLSLFNQIPQMPDDGVQPFVPDQDEDYILGDEDIDLTPALKILEQDRALHHLICGPQQLKTIFPHLLTPQQILKTSIGTCDFVVLTINSVITFPYKDLQDVVQTCTAVFSDTTTCIFKRSASRGDEVSGGFAEIVSSAMKNTDYLPILRQYRSTVSEKAQ